MEAGTVPQRMNQPGSTRIIISANAFWNIKNFRSSLIDALVGEGWKLLIAAPDAEPEWAAAHGAESSEIRVDRAGLNPLTDLTLIANYHKLMRRWRANYLLGFTAKPNIYGSIAGRFLVIA